MSAIVPWNNVGAAPCCCDDDEGGGDASIGCPDDEPLADVVVEISRSKAQALLQGGVFIQFTVTFPQATGTYFDIVEREITATVETAVGFTVLTTRPFDSSCSAGAFAQNFYENLLRRRLIFGPGFTQDSFSAILPSAAVSVRVRQSNNRYFLRVLFTAGIAQVCSTATSGAGTASVTALIDGQTYEFTKLVGPSSPSTQASLAGVIEANIIVDSFGLP